MAEIHIVVDVETSSLSSESMQLEASPLSESSPLSEAPVVVDLKASLQRELDTLRANMDEAKNFTIFRTPPKISKSKKDFFEPSTVSIGPFQHGQKHLRALEEQKRRFLQNFLSRGDHISLDLCLSEMKLLEMRTRKCYNETFDDLDSNAFVKMMLLDGCFVLEYFIKMVENNYMCFDEIGWNSIFIPYELLLLDNQIPFFIIDKLYEIGNLNKALDRMVFLKSIACNLLYQFGATEYSTDFLDSLDSLDSKIPDPPAEIHHLVHLCYHSLVPAIPEKAVVLSSKSFCTNRIKGLLKKRFPHSNSRSLLVSLSNSTGNISSIVIPSATELKQKGVKFAPKSNPKHMLDISFEYGVLKIPRLAITDATKPIFANLVAFEQSKYGKEQSVPFTMFVAFLDNLVNTPNDVTILQECGIIENWLSSEAELADFLNQVTQDCSVGLDHYLAELNTAVNRYIESSWHRHKAKLIRDYFSSPWSIISLIAAFILLVLTCVQSFYAVYTPRVHDA